MSDGAFIGWEVSFRRPKHEIWRLRHSPLSDLRLYRQHVNALPQTRLGQSTQHKKLESAMTMRTVSSERVAPPSLAGQFWARTVIDAFRRWLLAYKKWRAERAAIEQLQTMTDRELKDIGVTRTDIYGAVRRNAARYGVYSRYY
jgi:uncharacterized protein YjiS (DUF1127 family)